MRSLQTISYFSEDIEINVNRTSNRKRSSDAKRETGNAAQPKRKDRYTQAFLKHLTDKNWHKCIKYLKKLAGTSMFLPTIARGGFVITNGPKLKPKEVINLVIDQINRRNKIDWLKGVSYDGYVNMIANALYIEYRCDSVAAYFIIQNNRIRINRGWVNGWSATETARQMQR